MLQSLSAEMEFLPLVRSLVSLALKTAVISAFGGTSLDLVMVWKVWLVKTPVEIDLGSLDSLGEIGRRFYLLEYNLLDDRVCFLHDSASSLNECHELQVFVGIGQTQNLHLQEMLEYLSQTNV